MGGWLIKRGDSFIFVSYHNRDIKYVFQLSILLLRYYRQIWLDRFAIGLDEDWDEGVRQAREAAAGAIVIVSDDYLQSAYCRGEYEAFRDRGISITAVICRDFSTDGIAGFAFDDWIDLRNWFVAPDDHSVESLLACIPQSESVQQTGERLDYLRNLTQTLELQLSQMPTSRASLANWAAEDFAGVRPRGYSSGLLRSWAFSDLDSEEDATDLLSWARERPRFTLCGQAGSGKTTLARLLLLAYAHAAMRDDSAPLPIWLDLMAWEDGQESLDAYMEAQWGLVSYWKHWLAGHRALFVFDDWDDWAAMRPRAAAELTDWLAENPQHRLARLSTRAAGDKPTWPVLRVKPMSGSLALKFSSGFLTLEQQNIFRQLIRSQSALIENNHVDYLSMGIELLAFDKRLAVSEWPRNPLPALLALRHRQKQNLPELDKTLTGLQALAWGMMGHECHRFVPRAELEGQAAAEVIDGALEMGLLRAVGPRLRFEAEIFQWHLAAAGLRKAGLDKHLTAPTFTGDGGRLGQKWDGLAYALVDAASKEKRLGIIDQIAEIDPYLADRCLRRHPDLYGDYQEKLVARLIEISAQDPTSHTSLRDILHSLPHPNRTVEALAKQLPGFDDEARLWLWHEVLALPIQLPAAFVNSVADLNRELGTAEADLLADYARPLAAAYLAKLSHQQNEQIRSNAIWLLGEMRHRAAAVFLLDALEDDRAAPLDEVALALMKYADAAIYARLLGWLQGCPAQIEPVAAAMRRRRHDVSARLLLMAHEKRLTLKPQMFETMANYDEIEIALGLTRAASSFVELPETLRRVIADSEEAVDWQKQVAAGIERWPPRAGWRELLDDIARVIQNPPETMTRSDGPAAPRPAGDSAADAPGPPSDDEAHVGEGSVDSEDEVGVDEQAADDDTALEAADEMDEHPAEQGSDMTAPGDVKSSEPTAGRRQTFTDEEKLLRTLELLRHDDWGRTQKAAKFLRRFARHLRGSRNPTILRLLCRALGDKSWHVRWAAAEALAWFGHRGAIPSLRGRLDDASWIVQVAVIRSLVELEAKASAMAMTALLRSPHKSVREAAAEALGALQNPEVIPALGQTLKTDPDYFVRFAAIQSIHQISPNEAREYLDDALTDRYIHVRWYAMKALAPLMEADDIPLLARMARDRGKPLWEEKSIRDFAVLALQRINTPESQALLETISTAKKRSDS